MNVELRHLRALVAIGDEGTITGAADVLRISQPALSRTLNQLERRLGTVLVHRSTRHLELTPTGQRLWEEARSLLRHLDEALAHAASEPLPLRVGYAWAALGRHTVPLLRDWRRTRPDLPAQVHRVDDPTASLCRGEVDVAFLRTRPTDSRLTAEVLYREPRLAAVAEDHLVVDRTPLSLSDLARHPVVICPTTGTTSADLWPQEERPDTLLEVMNVDEWLTTIATGEAVGITAAATQHTHPRPGVRYLPLTDADPVPVYLAWPRASSHPATAAFRDQVHRTVGQDHP